MASSLHLPGVRRCTALLALAGTALALLVATAGPARADDLQARVEAGTGFAASRGTTIGLAVLDRETGDYADNGPAARRQVDSASIVKLFIAESLLRRAALGQLALDRATSDSLGLMLRSSDDAAASRLWSRYGGSRLVTDVAGRYGLTGTAPPANPRYWGTTRITAHDIARFYAGVLGGTGGLPPAARDVLVGHLRAATSHGTDGVYQWFGLRDGLPREPVLGLKQGWMCCFDGVVVRHSTAVVGPGSRFVVVALAQDPSRAGGRHTEGSLTGAVQRMFPEGFVPGPPSTLIARAWAGQGGALGRLGAAVGPETATPDGSGSYRWYQHGAVYWSPATGARWMAGSILDAWARAGYELGPLGYPTTDELPVAGGRGAATWFERGAVYWSPATGARSVRGGILAAWAAEGFERGRLGLPTTEEAATVDGSGSFGWFEGGAVYWSPATGAQVLSGEILAAWVAQGYEQGPLGYPTTGEHPTADGRGSATWFEHGTAFRSPATGAHWLTGPVLAAWIAQGLERGPLGYPVSDPYPVAGGTRVDFQGGSLVADATGQVAPPVAGAAVGG